MQVPAKFNFHVVHLDPTFGDERYDERTQDMVSDSVQDKSYMPRAKIICQFLDFLKNRSLVEFNEFHVMNFLAGRKDLRSARTAICTALHTSTGANLSDDIRIRRLVEGHAYKHPKMAKYDSMWDIRQLWDFFRKGFWSDRPGIMRRTKAVALLRASIAARNCDIAHVHRQMKWTADAVSFRFYKWKTQRKEKLLYSRWFSVKKLPARQAHKCAYRALADYVFYYAEYFERIASSPNNPELWLSYDGKNPVGMETLAKCTTELLREAGIDACYGQGTIRHAVITYWRSKSVSRDQCLDRTGQRSRSLIDKFYDLSAREVDINAEIDSDVDSEVDIDDFGEECS